MPRSGACSRRSGARSGPTSSRAASRSASCCRRALASTSSRAEPLSSAPSGGSPTATPEPPSTRRRTRSRSSPTRCCRPSAATGSTWPATWPTSCSCARWRSPLERRSRWAGTIWRRPSAPRRRFVEREPFREGGYALLMEAQARRGNVAEALRTFEQLRVLLRDELGATPVARRSSRCTSACCASELPRRRAPAPRGAGPALPLVTPRTSEGAFVGREAALGAPAHAAGRDSRAGRTRLVLCSSARPGVGKTRLARQLRRARCTPRARAVLYGRADEEALLPYQPFVEALRHLVAHAGRDFVGGRRARARDPQPPASRPRAAGASAASVAVDQRHAALPALRGGRRRCCARAARRWPLLLVLDDLHWADKPTLLLLRHLLRHPTATRHARRRHVPPRRAGARPSARRRCSTRPAARAALRPPDARRASTTTRRARSSPTGSDAPSRPAFVRRLQRADRGQRVLHRGDAARARRRRAGRGRRSVDADALERLGVPEGVARGDPAGASASSPRSRRELLTAASVVGRDFRARDRRAARRRRRPERSWRALEECMAAGLVSRLPDARRRLHVLARARARGALRDELSGEPPRAPAPPRRRGARAAGRAASRVNPAELAHHFDAAPATSPGPARRAATRSPPAERATELLAYEEAAEHYRRRARRCSDDDDEAARCEVLLALGRVQWHAGDDGARAHVPRAAADSASPRGDADQLARAALGLGERYCESALRRLRATASCSRRRSPRSAPRTARCARCCWRGWPRTSRSRDEHERAPALSAEARRDGPPARRRERCCSRRSWPVTSRCSTSATSTSGSRSSDELSALARRPPRARRRAPPLAPVRPARESATSTRRPAEHAALEALAAQLRQPLFQRSRSAGAACGPSSPATSQLAERCAEECLRSGARRAHPGRRRARGPRSSSRCAGARAGSASWRRSSSASPASGGHSSGWLSALGPPALRDRRREEARADLRARSSGPGPAGCRAGCSGSYARRAAQRAVRQARRRRAAPSALYAALAPHAHRNVVVALLRFWGPVERYLALLAETCGDERARGPPRPLGAGAHPRDRRPAAHRGARAAARRPHRDGLTTVPFERKQTT